MNEDINYLAFDPPYSVLEMNKSIFLYTLRLEKWTFHSLKMLNPKCRSLEGKFEELQSKEDERGLEEKEVENIGNLDLIEELKRKFHKVDNVIKDAFYRYYGFLQATIDDMNIMLDNLDQEKEVNLMLILEEAKKEVEIFFSRKMYPIKHKKKRKKGTQIDKKDIKQVIDQMKFIQLELKDKVEVLSQPLSPVWCFLFLYLCQLVSVLDCTSFSGIFLP